MNALHHALVSFGSPADVREFALFIAKKLGISASANANFHIRTYATLDVDEAREIRELMSLSGEGSRVFVIGAQAIGREAQNALLKILEEPGEGVTFAFRIPRGALIGTVLSRLSEIAFTAKAGDTKAALEFLGANAASRSKLIEKVIKDKDKQVAYELVCAIESELQKRISERSVGRALEEIEAMRSYLMDPSASIKMILEHLALVIPKL